MAFNRSAPEDSRQPPKNSSRSKTSINTGKIRSSNQYQHISTTNPSKDAQINAISTSS